MLAYFGFHCFENMLQPQSLELSLRYPHGLDQLGRAKRKFTDPLNLPPKKHPKATHKVAGYYYEVGVIGV